MKKCVYFFSVLVLLVGFSACSTTRFVKPLEAKEVAAGFDFGGPIINFAGLKIPIPITSFSAGYGVDSTLTVFGGLNTTALGFGTFHIDAGVTKDIIRAKGRIPGFSITPSAHFMMDIWEARFRFYPQVDLNVHWAYSLKHKHFAYFTWSNWFDLWAKKAHQEPQNVHYIPAIGIGNTFVSKKGRMHYTLEVKYLAPFYDNQSLTVTYNGIGGTGSLGVYFGMRYIFNKK